MVFRFIILSVITLLTSSFFVKTDALSMSFTSKILENKKYLVVEGEVYFKKKNGVLTTHFTKPFENITIVNADGEMSIYDVQENTLVRSRSSLNSSESSYFWHFLNGNCSDLGFIKNGYVIKNTKVEDGVLITNLVPKEGFNSPIARIEMVHEKSLPIYLEFLGPKNKKLGKIFFSSYQKIGETSIPLKITEIAYKEKGDSVVTAKTYFNPKTNANVDLKYLEFKIPANAKVVSPK